MLTLLISLASSILRSSAIPASLEFTNTSQVFDGSPKSPTVTTSPAGLNYELRYIDPAAPPPSAVIDTIYQSTPSALALSYSSLAYLAHQTWAYGDFIQFAGTARELHSVDIAMVTWAKASTYPTFAAANPNGWTQPLRLTVYSRNSTTGQLTEITSISRNVFVPWRPLTLPNGSPYPYNGHALRASFQFPAGITLPSQAMFMLESNAQGTGFQPYSTSGPYNELNIAVGGSATIGTDVDNDTLLVVKNTTTWYYPQAADDLRMLVRAKRIPDLGTTTPPVNAGSWQLSAKITKSAPALSPPNSPTPMPIPTTTDAVISSNTPPAHYLTSPNKAPTHHSALSPLITAGPHAFKEKSTAATSNTSSNPPTPPLVHGCPCPSLQRKSPRPTRNTKASATPPTVDTKKFFRLNVTTSQP